MLKQFFKDAALNNPIELRDALKDPDVVKALSDIAVLPKILELHAPSADSRKTTGLGDTLCNRRGTRHAEVTCGLCLKMAAARSVVKVPTREVSQSELEKTLLAQKSRVPKKGDKGQRSGGIGGGGGGG